MSDNLSTKNFACKDHFLTQEEFTLVYDPQRFLWRTTPQPSEEAIGRYYQSEDYLPHSKDKRTFFHKAYQRAKRYYLRYKVRLLRKLHPSKGSLLDVGAGTGEFLLAAKKDGWTVGGVEPSERARQLAREEGVTLEEKLFAFNNAQYDCITLWHVLEHLHDLEERVAQLSKMVKDGGYLIVAVPNYRSYDAAHYGPFWAGYDVPRHLWHFSSDSIEVLFNGTGLTVVKTLPMKLDSYYVSLLSEKYRHGRSRPLHAFWTGWRSNLKAKVSGEYSSLIFVLKKP